VQFLRFGCIGHSLHLIVGPLFAQKNQGANNDGDGDDGNVEILDDTVDYDSDEVIEILDTCTDQRDIKKMLSLNKTVNNFRQVAKVVRKATVSKCHFFLRPSVVRPKMTSFSS